MKRTGRVPKQQVLKGFGLEEVQPKTKPAPVVFPEEPPYERIFHCVVRVRKVDGKTSAANDKD